MSLWRRRCWSRRLAQLERGPSRIRLARPSPWAFVASVSGWIETMMSRMRVPDDLRDDVRQDIAEDLVIVAPRFDPRRGSATTFATAWIRSAIQRSVHDHRRRCGFGPRSPRLGHVTCADVDVDRMDRGSPAIDAEIMSGRQRERVSFEIQGLTRRERIVVRARLADRAWSDIAVDLGTCRQNVQRIYGDAVAKLRKRLAAHALR